MNISDFNNLKKKIEQAKTNRDRAEGAKSKIEEQWKKEFNISTIEEAEQLIKDLEKDIEKDENKLEKLYNEIEEIVNKEEEDE
jgi:flagellar biosynthesis chaperone FliJ